MPNLPTYRSQGSLPSAGFQQPTVADFGGSTFRAVDQMNDTFRQIQAGADVAETQQLIGQTSEDLHTVVVNEKMTTADPETFNANVTKGLKDTWDNALKRASNSTVRRNVEAQLTNNYAAAQRLGQIEYFGKKKDRATAHMDTELDRLAKAAVNEPDDARRMEYSEAAGALIGPMVATNYLDANKAGDIARAWEKTVNANRMTLLAKKGPGEFITRVERGDFDNQGIDPLIIKNALDIAGQVAHLRSVRDAQEMKKESAFVQRELEKLAEVRHLDPRDVDKAADLYGWSGDDKKKLINMQIGVKPASPYEVKLINDAMAPADARARYTRGDIIAAEKNLIDGVKGGTISSGTSEYRDAMRHLQSMNRALDIKADVGDYRTEAAARQAIQDAYGVRFPGRRDERVGAEIKRHNQVIRDLRPNERDAYTKGVREKLDKDAVTDKSPTIREDELRGILKR